MKAREPYAFTNYIYRDLMAEGFTSPRKVVLRHLERLRGMGKLTRSETPTGYYGYEWKLTR